MADVRRGEVRPRLQAPAKSPLTPLCQRGGNAWTEPQSPPDLATQYPASVTNGPQHYAIDNDEPP